jgi:hypothetical protein
MFLIGLKVVLAITEDSTDQEAEDFLAEALTAEDFGGNILKLINRIEVDLKNRLKLSGLVVS